MHKDCMRDAESSECTEIKHSSHSKTITPSLLWLTRRNKGKYAAREGVNER